MNGNTLQRDIPDPPVEKPTYLPVSPDHIPEHLKSALTWVAWRAEYRRGAKKPWTKVPINPTTGRNAKSSDPETGGTFEQAYTYYQEHRERVDGIGPILTRASGIVGIDLDHCRDPETGHLEEWAEDLIQSLNSYTEVSPSGEGMHIFIRAKFPAGGGNRKGSIEMYCEGRYLTTTGSKRDDLSPTIEPRQEAFDQLHRSVFGTSDTQAGTSARQAPTVCIPPAANLTVLPDEEILKKALGARNGAKVQRLWFGDISEYDDDDSRADQALCTHLAFWTKDKEQIDRVFRQSALYREKWERKDYRERTINSALQCVTETYSPHGPSKTDPYVVAQTAAQLVELPEDTSQWHFSMIALRVSACELLMEMKPHLNNSIVFNNIDALRQLPGSRLNAIGQTLRDIIPKFSAPSLIKAVAALNEEMGEEEASSPTPHGVAEHILQAHHFATDVGHRLYYYQDGAYRNDGKYIAKQLIKFAMISQGHADQWEKKLSDDTVEYITIDAPRLWATPPLNIINLQNGLYDLQARVLRAHSPQHYSPVQLPVRYHPQARCPRINQFIREVFPADSIELAYEIAAWLMVPDTSIQKAILLLGRGGNGKSTYLNMLVRFIGRMNTTSMSLHKLGENTFAAASLVGKLANICPDLPTRDLQNTSLFKMLTGGEAQMSAERKHADAFEFEPFARLVFSANEYPRSGDLTEAFIDRWVVIPFPHSFREKEGAKQRRDLDAELTDPEELSGFLNQALQRLPRVLRVGFSRTQSTTEALKGFRQVTDKVAVWLNEATMTAGQAVVSKDALHQAYLDDTGDTGMYKETFGAHIMRLRKDHGLRDGQRTYNGQRRVTCWIGIGFKEE